MNLNKCVSGGQEREDRTVKAQANFEPLSVEIKYPDTAIILLRSPERPILLAAAASLSKFGEKAKGNLEALFDLNVVDNILALIDHEDLFTRRFALKLLALMTAVQNVQAHLLKTDFYIMFFTEMLNTETDIFLQEFASRILAELSSDPSGAALILEKFDDLSFVFQNLESIDPDIKKNCIEILNNLIKDLNGFKIITSTKDFSFAAIYELLKQPYAIVQKLTLNFIEYLLLYNLDDDIHEKFRASGGVQSLLEFINHEEWKDLHCKVLHILHLSSDNLKTAEYINKTDAIRQLISFMESTENDTLKFGALKILIRLARTLNGRKLLHFQELVTYMFKYLQAYKEPYVHALICEGIAKMTQYAPSAIDLLQENPIPFILKLLNNTGASWSERQAAAFALKKLFTSHLQNCINFLDINGPHDLICLIQQPLNNVPVEIQVTVIETITAIADYSSIAQDLIDINLFCALCSILEVSAIFVDVAWWDNLVSAIYAEMVVSVLNPENKAADELKIASCNALVRFPINEEARKILVQVNAFQKLFHSITDAETVPVRNAATQLVLILSSDSFLANLCTQQGYLVYMLKNRSAARVITSWDSCIEALLSADLPMKFAFLRRLSLHDITTDGFYVMRHNSCPFPVLEELFRLKLCPLEPIYVVNFKKPESVEQHYCESEEIAMEAARENLRRESFRKGLLVSEGTINSWLEVKFGRLQVDCDLIKYLELFKTELEVSEAEENHSWKGSSPGLVEVSKIASRARKLGKFVARQMAGIDPSNNLCIEQQLEWHLGKIKDKIETSIIPLGLLRVGSTLERSLLFKVMADRIALPASLVRGRYGKSWIEIAVPVIEASSNNMSSMDFSKADNNTKYLPKFCLLPPKYLHENFIVDLVTVPGDLIPIKSDRGRRYYTMSSGCQFPCCK